MLLAVTEKEWALAAFAAVFIVFAIVSAFFLPRRNPDFPGERLPLFVGASVFMFGAMIAAVFAFAGEEGAGAHETGGGEPETTLTSEPGPGGPPAGDAAAGERVFASSGCGGCHTLEAAGASGAVGPNLDESQPSFELVVDRVTNGSGAMPPFKGQLSEEQIRDVAAFVVQSTS